MRKQTKLVAVASAAALLAIGASMTSFAATGWVEEGGEWFYYNNDGSKAEDEWKKSGDKWFWLDSENDGAMAIDKLVVDGDNTYYVDSTGAMVANTWVKVVNEEQDDEDDPAEYNYYYMQNNGKAYTAGDNGSTKFKTIDGKRYAFDDEGKMLYGWVDGTGNRLSSEDEWTTVAADVYYLGNWDDGAMKTGWQKIYVHDPDEDEDMDHWFYFKSNGKRFYNDDISKGEIKTRTVNGKKYGFDDRGVMVYEWTVATTADGLASSSSWQYFRSPEDGARMTKGWFKVIAPDEDNSFSSKYNASFATKDADEEEERWYYADGNGKLAVGEVKKIKGKYYAFRPDNGEKGAAMLNGLVLMRVAADGTIAELQDDGVDADELSDILSGDYTVNAGCTLYYFGNDADNDGSMKTGATTVSLDGDTYNFYFSKSGGVEGKGKGESGIDDKKYIYKYGCRIKADSDDKYQLVKVTSLKGDKTIGSSDVVVSKVDSRLLRTGTAPYTLNASTDNKDGDPISYVGTTDLADHYLVNSSGSISGTKTAAKDGADWFFYVYKKGSAEPVIKMYTNEKTLTDAKTGTGVKLSDWKDSNID